MNFVLRVSLLLLSASAPRLAAPLCDGDNPSQELMHAIFDGNTAVAQACIRRRVNVNQRLPNDYGEGSYPLELAINQNQLSMVRLLIKNKAKLTVMSQADSDGRRTPLLVYAADFGHTPIVLELIRAGAKIETRDTRGTTALNIAAYRGNTKTVEALLKKGARTESGDVSGFTPLHAAAYEGHTETVLALLRGGAKINTADKEGNTAVLLAAGRSHAEILALLLTKKADFRKKTRKGETALHLAMQECPGRPPEVLEVLLKAGVAVNAARQDGKTALMLAAENGCSDSVEKLLSARAQVNTKDKEGANALTYAYSNQQKEAESVLRKAGAEEQPNHPLWIAEEDRRQKYCVQGKRYRLLIHSVPMFTINDRTESPREYITKQAPRSVLRSGRRGGPEGENTSCAEFSGMEESQVKELIRHLRQVHKDKPGYTFTENQAFRESW